MFDYVSFLKDAVVAGVPLVLVILVLVEFAKNMGVAGKALFVVSLVIGLVLGSGYMVYTTPPPPLSAGWYVLFQYIFSCVIFGLASGGLASGFYDLLKGMFQRAAQKFMLNTNKNLRSWHVH